MAEVAEEIAEVAGDGVAQAMHAVSEEAQAVAKVAQGLDGMRVEFIGLGVAIGATLGGLTAWYITMRKAKKDLEKQVAEEVEQVKEHYRAREMARQGEAEKPDLADLEQAYQDKVQEAGYDAPIPAPVININARPEHRNAFDESAKEEEKAGPVVPVWDYAAELEGRDPNWPYIIHEDEFRENEPEHEQGAYTFYEGDEVLCDDRDNMIPLLDEKVGLHHLNQFGHGSGHPDVVFIRNEALSTDFEITRHSGHYAVEVQGLDDPSLEHSEFSVKRRFDDDE